MLNNMQLYAIDDNHHLVAANSASKQKNYQCLECQGIVRLRGGFHRQNHFYHHKPSVDCRLNGKSLQHLHIQLYLQQLIGELNCRLEHHFPSINRIADVVWFAEKIVFEIQCSPISVEEVRARNADYALLDYQVIWILHETQFNKIRLSAAEAFLKKHDYYFTNMNQSGEGIIYDQFQLIDLDFRKSILPKLKINCSKLAKDPSFSHLPKPIRNYLAHRKIYFDGDLAYECLQGSAYAHAAEQILKKHFSIKISDVINWFTLVWKKRISHPYKSIFRMLLEKACR